jgi:hypothetical protein
VSGGIPRSVRWNLGTRFGFRLSLAYLVLYAFPFPLDFPLLAIFSPVIGRVSGVLLFRGLANTFSI